MFLRGKENIQTTRMASEGEPKLDYINGLLAAFFKAKHNRDTSEGGSQTGFNARKMIRIAIVLAALGFPLWHAF